MRKTDLVFRFMKNAVGSMCFSFRGVSSQTTPVFENDWNDLPFLFFNIPVSGNTTNIYINTFILYQLVFMRASYKDYALTIAGI